ncbi:2051_t:CDS:2 [Ambispora leptoticha]|uniref:2051_t:CDS:1 n=1 Tax=Ambispora leptoticha TaxID=144679 RepID=A0A9N8WMG8_9GLOM|nr:2051_t:CDS:2 [Ambispora leptoticha]
MNHKQLRWHIQPKAPIVQNIRSVLATSTNLLFRTVLRGISQKSEASLNAAESQSDSNKARKRELAVKKSDAIFSAVKQNVPQEKVKIIYRNSSDKNLQKLVENSPIAHEKSQPRYYGIAVELDVKNYLKNLVNQLGLDNTIFETLVRNQRIPPEHHVTLIHAAALRKSRSREFQELWEKYRNMVDNDYKLCRVELYVDKIVYNSQIMALVLREIDPPEITSINKIPHITVGTINDSVKPVESNQMLEAALLVVNGKGKRQSDVQIIQLERDLHVFGTIRGFY